MRMTRKAFKNEKLWEHDCVACFSHHGRNISFKQKFQYNECVHESEPPGVCFFLILWLVWIKPTSDLWPFLPTGTRVLLRYFSAWSELLETNWIVGQIINSGAGTWTLTNAATLEASVSSCLLVTNYLCVNIQFTIQLYFHFLKRKILYHDTNYLTLL